MISKLGVFCQQINVKINVASCLDSASFLAARIGRIKKMKNLVISKYENKGKNLVWGIVLLFADWIDCISDYLASVPEKKNPFPEFYREGDKDIPDGKKVGDSRGLGTPAEQAMAAFANAYNTAKISKPHMAGWSEQSVLDYCAKNLIKVAADSQGLGAKLDEQKQINQDIIKMAIELSTLKEGSKRHIELSAEFKALQKA